MMLIHDSVLPGAEDDLFKYLFALAVCQRMPSR